MAGRELFALARENLFVKITKKFLLVRVCDAEHTRLTFETNNFNGEESRGLADLLQCC
jgi:hypothetical protein